MNSVKINEVIQYLEQLAPKAYQENYDNAGLITGHADWRVNGVLTTLDCTEPIVEEAIRRKANLIVAHHPIVFRPLKSLVPNSYVTLTLEKAIKSDIAIYAVHTNLDSVLGGVNRIIADRIGLTNQRILDPRRDTLAKLVTFVPKDHVEQVMQALYRAGAGSIGEYVDCSFRSEGTGTFTPSDRAQPHIGEAGKSETVDETRVEVILPRHLEGRVLAALRSAHPYEEVAHYLTYLENVNQEVGTGMIGDLPIPEDTYGLLRRLKSVFNCAVVRHTQPVKPEVKTIALCGGSGAFLLPRAIQAGADLYISSDFKYHQFFDAEDRLVIADIGHFESEQFTIGWLAEVLSRKFPTFAVNFSETPTNPIRYL